jgi:hypothetical protein
MHDWIDHILQILQLVVMAVTYMHHRKKVEDKKDPETDADYGDLQS